MAVARTWLWDSAIADPALCAASGWKGVSVIPIAQRLGVSAATRYGYVSAGRLAMQASGQTFMRLMTDGALEG
jgi:hypothetical protein